MREGDDVQVTIQALHKSGAGVVRSTDKRPPLRVMGAFPGERALVRLSHIGKNLGHGKLLEIVQPDPARRAAPCDQHESHDSGRCTGCGLMPLTPARQRQLKRQWLEEEHGLVVDDLRWGSGKAYRWSSKRVAFGGPGNVRLGSYIRGSHRVALMYGCGVEHPVVAQAMLLVERAARRTELTGYDETKDRGDLRHVWVKTDGERALITLIVANDEPERVQHLIEVMEGDRDAELVAGVAVSVHREHGNAVRGDQAEVVFGDAALRVQIAGVPTEVGPLGFLQPNPVVAADCYRDLIEGVTGGSVWDLYAGAGITTELLRRAGATVTPVESYAESAAALGVTPGTAADFLADAQQRGETPDVVVANPPRKGMGEAVTTALREIGPSEIRIMSCGPAGLARDLLALGATGDGARYEMTQLHAYETLPQTPHIELVARLRRVV